MKAAICLRQSAIDILSGFVIGSHDLRMAHAHGRYKYPFWILKSDLDLFLRSDFNTNGVTIRSGEQSINASLSFSPVTQYYNIEQLSNPFSMFKHLLYNRHFYSTTDRPFRFEHQCILHKHAQKHGFKQKVWVSKDHLLINCTNREFYLRDDHKSVLFPGYFNPLYNIEQANDPPRLRKYLENVPKSLVSGKIVNSKNIYLLCMYQFDKGYTLPLWCSCRQLNLLDVPLRRDAEGVFVRDGNEEKTFYNIEDFTDTLALFKNYWIERGLTYSCADMLSRMTFSRNDVRRLWKFRLETGFRSKFWVRQCDLAFIGAVCRPTEEGRTVRCSSGEWHNMNQMANVREAMHRVFSLNLRNTYIKKSLDVFESIINK